MYYSPDANTHPQRMYLKFSVNKTSSYQLTCKLNTNPPYPLIPVLYDLPISAFEFHENSTTWNNQAAPGCVLNATGVDTLGNFRIITACPPIQPIGAGTINGAYVGFPLILMTAGQPRQFIVTQSNPADPGHPGMYSRKSATPCWLNMTGCMLDSECPYESEYCNLSANTCQLYNIHLNATFRPLDSNMWIDIRYYNLTEISGSNLSAYLYYMTNTSAPNNWTYMGDGPYSPSGIFSGIIAPGIYQYKVIVADLNLDTYGASAPLTVSTGSANFTKAIGGYVYKENTNQTIPYATVSISGVGSLQGTYLSTTSWIDGSYYIAIPPEYQANTYYLSATAMIGGAAYANSMYLSIPGYTANQNIRLFTSGGLSTMTFIIENINDGSVIIGEPGNVWINGITTGFFGSCAINTSIGTCSISNIPSGFYRIDANASGYSPFMINAQINSSGNMMLLMNPIAITEVYGGVSLLSSSSMIPNVTIMFTNTQTGAVITALTNVTGYYSVSVLSGIYNVIPIKADYTPKTIYMNEVISGSNQILVFLMDFANLSASNNTVTLSGYVTDGASPINQVLIYGRCFGAGPTKTINAYTDSSGFYSQILIQDGFRCQYNATKPPYIPVYVQVDMHRNISRNITMDLFSQNSIIVSGSLKSCDGTDLSDYSISILNGVTVSIGSNPFDIGLLQSTNYTITYYKTGWTTRTQTFMTPAEVGFVIYPPCMTYTGATTLSSSASSASSSIASIASSAITTTTIGPGGPTTTLISNENQAGVWSAVNLCFGSVLPVFVIIAGCGGLFLFMFFLKIWDALM
jgi:hypothetical protein